QAAFYVNARGFTSSLIPGAANSFETVFDFIDHRLLILATDGRTAEIKLTDMAVSDFYSKFKAALKHLGAPTGIHHAPNEVENALPFAAQTEPGVYDPQVAQDFWRALLACDLVFKKFRTGFLGKSSPVHLFWGSFDLAVTRFSGRTAPIHPGGIPALPDEITREAYSHEVSSAGFWPGGGATNFPAFYAYAYPTPDGFSKADPGHKYAYFDDAFGEFILPYDAIRKAKTPEADLLAFLQSTYSAAADLGGWDRAALESELGEPRRPRAVG
ncbi:MAG: DUF5996 family protein, partial [Pseudomonadota bacterium]